MMIPKEMNLLYIEDDESTADVTSKLLKTFKHTKFNIVQKGNLANALQYLKDNCPKCNNCNIDVILLDLMLPNSQGINTYIRVKELCDFIPVVIISDFEDIACECVALGAQDYLLKSDLNSGLLIRSLKYSIERKRLTDEKIDLENKFRNVIQSTPLGVHMYELINGELIFSGHNSAADIILGVDNHEFIGKTLEEAFPTIDPNIAIEYRKVIATGNAWNEDVIYYEDSHISGSFRVHAFKTALNRMATSFEDVSARVEMEESLKKSEKQHRELVEATGASIYEIDFLTMKFTYVNDVMCKMTGWNKEELFELGPTDFLTEKGLREFSNRMEALKYGEYIPQSHEYEIKVKDGSTRWAVITAIFKEDDKNNIIGARVVAIDITDKKAAEEESNKKEETIFNELENKIQEWREEISVKTIANRIKLEKITLNINSMSNQAEVQ